MLLKTLLTMLGLWNSFHHKLSPQPANSTLPPTLPYPQLSLIPDKPHFCPLPRRNWSSPVSYLEAPRVPPVVPLTELPSFCVLGKSVVSLPPPQDGEGREWIPFSLRSHAALRGNILFEINIPVLRVWVHSLKVSAKAVNWLGSATFLRSGGVWKVFGFFRALRNLNMWAKLC